MHSRYVNTLDSYVSRCYIDMYYIMGEGGVIAGRGMLNWDWLNTPFKKNPKGDLFKQRGQLVCWPCYVRSTTSMGSVVRSMGNVYVMAQHFGCAWGL